MVVTSAFADSSARPRARRAPESRVTSARNRVARSAFFAVSLALIGAMPVEARGAREVPASPPAGQPESIARQLEVYISFASSSGYDTLARLLKESLFQAIRTGNPGLRIVDAAGTTAEAATAATTGDVADSGSPTPGSRTLSARRAGADSWLSAEVRIAETGDTVHVVAVYEVFDIIGDRELGSGTIEKDIDSRLRNINPTFWQEPAAVAATDLTPRTPSQTLTVNATSGSRVVISDGRRHRRGDPETAGTAAPSGTPGDPADGAAGARRSAPDTRGSIDFSLAAPGTYSLTVTRSGYYPVATSVTLLDQPVTADVPQHRKSPFVFDLDMERMTFPRLQLGLMVLPDRLFLRAYLGGYLVSLLPVLDNRDSPLFGSLPLATFGFGAGAYLSGGSGTFRLFAAASVFARFEFPAGFIGFDPIVPGGVELELGTELLAASPLRGVIAFTPRAYYAPDPGLALSQFSSSSRVSQYLEIGPMLLDIPEFYLGVRYQPEARR